MNLHLFSNRLKTLRVDCKLTLQQVGDGVGSTRHTIGNLENARKAPSLEMITLLADYFDVSVDYLLGRTDNPEINSREAD